MALPVLRYRGAVGTRGWDPFGDFTDVHQQLGRLLGASLAPTGQQATRWSPRADVSETDEAFVVELDVPGVKREDITAEVDEGRLTVSGEYQEQEREGTLRHRTRRDGKFGFRVNLGDVNAEGVTAELTDGVLTVRVPKAEKAKPHRVEITSA